MNELHRLARDGELDEVRVKIHAANGHAVTLPGAASMAGVEGRMLRAPAGGVLLSETY